MIEPKVCSRCSNTFPSHFFKGDICVPCTVALEQASKEPTKKQEYYTEEEPVCTSCNG